MMTWTSADANTKPDKYAENTNHHEHVKIERNGSFNERDEYLSLLTHCLVYLVQS
jgi:hypothetical protein